MKMKYKKYPKLKNILNEILFGKESVKKTVKILVAVQPEISDWRYVIKEKS